MTFIQRLWRGLSRADFAEDMALPAAFAPKLIPLSAVMICREAVVVLSDILGPDTRIALPGPPGIWAPTAMSVRITIDRRDLDLCLEDFSARYLAPAMTAMASSIPDHRMLWPIPQPLPRDTFSASEMMNGVAVLLEEVQPDPGETALESDMRLRFSIQTVPKE